MLPVEPRRPAKLHYKYTTETNFVAMDMMDNASALPTCPQRNNKRRQRFKNGPKSPTHLPEEAKFILAVQAIYV
jgi:hypothetical protein